MDRFSAINDLKLEGVDSIVSRYKTLCDNLKKHSFDGAEQMKKDVSCCGNLFGIKTIVQMKINEWKSLIGKHYLLCVLGEEATIN